MKLREGLIERPVLEQFSNTPMFNTKAVVQQTGVPAATLRAWERRYSLLSPERAENTYRLYSEQDVMLIRWLKERVDNGMSISQAIALFKHKNEAEPAQEGQNNSGVSKNSLSSRSTADDEEQTRQGSDAESVFHVVLPTGEKADTSKTQSENISFTHWPIIGEEPTPKQLDYPPTYNMHVVRERLIDAFMMLDEPMSQMIMGSMLAIYPVEQVCVELITPTMWQIGQLWLEGKLTVSVEHFASNFFRAILTNLFHITPGLVSGPIAIVSCAPGEPHELAPLMLALFLRRKGARVIYLGQSIEIAGLIQTIKQLSPKLVCVSLTMPAYLTEIIDLGQQLNELAAPHPIFAFGGQVFTHYANIIPQIPGVYLSGDLQVIVDQLYAMLQKYMDSSN